MRYVYATLAGLVTLAVLLFMVQNRASVTVSFMQASVTLPIWLVVVTVYVLGMVSGGAFWSVLRSWFRGALPPR
jgi:uncharacterized integral membrane protein